MSTLKVNAIQTTGGVDVSNKILQVINVIKQDTYQTNSTTYVAVSGLSITITPKFSSSSILIIPAINGNSQNRGGVLRLYRNGAEVSGLMPTSAGSRGTTNIGSPWTGDASGDQGMMFNSVMPLLDSPGTTSATTYAVYARSVDGSVYGTRINWTNDDTDASDFVRGVSTLTVMEVQA